MLLSQDNFERVKSSFLSQEKLYLSPDNMKNMWYVDSGLGRMDQYRLFSLPQPIDTLDELKIFLKSKPTIVAALGIYSYIQTVLNIPVTYVVVAELSLTIALGTARSLLMIIDNMKFAHFSTDLPSYISFSNDRVEFIEEPKVYDVPVSTMEIDKSDPDTYFNEKKAEAYVSQSYSSRVADLVSIIKCTPPSNIVAPNDGAGACYKAAQILGRPVISSDPSPAMCTLAQKMGNVVKCEKSRITVDNYIGPKTTLFIVSHSEELDSGLAAYIFNRGFRLLVFESKIGYKGYNKLHPCHPFIRTSFPWSLPIMLSRNYKSVDTVAWVNISQTSSVTISEVSCIPYVYAPFYLLREPMLVRPLTEQVRESLDPSMIRLGKSTTEEIAVWMKSVVGDKGYWVVRGMYHDIPRQKSIVFIKGHGAFVPTPTGKSVMNGISYTFLTLTKWIEVVYQNCPVQTQICDISDVNKTIVCSDVRVLATGNNSSTYWFDIWKGPNLCNVSSSRYFLPDVKVNLRVDNYALPLKILGLLSSAGDMEYDLSTQMFRSNENSSYTEFVFLLGTEAGITHVTEVLTAYQAYNRIRFRELKGWSQEYSRYVTKGRMQCETSNTIKLWDTYTDEAYDTGVLSWEQALTTIRRRKCDILGVPWRPCPVPKFIDDYWYDFTQFDSTRRVGPFM